MSGTPPTQANPTGEPLLRMSGVQKRFGATVALGGVDLHVHAGEVLALMGENGAGKSTLMKVLSGAHQPDAGSMWLDGHPFKPRGPIDSRRAGVSMIYQELSLVPDLTVTENILLGIEPVSGPLLKLGEMRRVCREAMAEVGRPDIPLDAKVGRLSIAQQQLIEIARSVALKSRVLVLDEPTSSLTRADIESLFKLIRRFRQQGKAIIYISHFLEEIQEISDRFEVLRDGTSVGGDMTKNADQGRIISMMVGRTVEDLYPRSPREPGELALQIDGLSGVRTPTGASLKLFRGEVVGIAGLVGAGRTEFLRAIFGLDAVKSGQVRISTNTEPRYPENKRIDPHDASPLPARVSPMQRWRQGLGMVSEDRKTEGLALDLSIADNLTLPRLPRILNPAQLEAEAVAHTQHLAVKCRAVTQPIGDLSGGNQQKVAIARLLYYGSDVLLLDEPTRGIDVGSKAHIYKVIDEMACEGKAVLVVSSYLPELLGICDRIAVMCRGKLGPARPVAELDQHKIMLEAIGPDPIAENAKAATAGVNA